MFISVPKNPGPLKHFVYLAASVFLGLILGMIAHAYIEMGYLSWARSQNLLVPFYGGCALPPVMQATLLMAGAVVGFLTGRWWWRKVYVERIWSKAKRRRRSR